MAWLHLCLPVVEARLILDRTDRIARAQHQLETDAAQNGSAIETVTTGLAEMPMAELGARTLEQTRVDVIRDLLLESTPAHLPTERGRAKSSVRITIPALALLGLSEEPAPLDGYGPIDLETARRIASHAPSFQRLITDPLTSSTKRLGNSPSCQRACSAGCHRSGGSATPIPPPRCGSRQARCDHPWRRLQFAKRHRSSQPFPQGE